MLIDSLLRFGPYQFDAARGQLQRGSQIVKLTPKALALLRLFVTQAGQVVTKEELFRTVWPDTVVSDAALTACILELRQALRDNARTPRYIETVHRRGFRFIAPVAASAATVPSAELRVPSQEEANSQHPVDSSQEEESQKPVLSPSTSLGMNSVEGATSNDSLESSVQSLESENQNSPLLSAQSLDARRQTLDVSARARFTRSFVVAAVLLLTATILTVQYLSRPSLSTQSSALRTLEAQLPLPDKPSLIVLPFVNLSKDPEQEYFSDGLTEVLTGNLSKISSLFVIARNSAFTYKGKAVKVQDVGREMGVRYVLEGSVQKADQQVRIAVQLIEAATGYHLWSEQYDRPLQDLFALQDEIVQKIVTTLRLQLTLEEHGVIVHKHTDNLEAYDAFLRGQERYFRFTKEANVQARQMSEKAIALDPQYAEAYAALGFTYWLEWSWRWSADPQTLERALALAHQALALDDSLPAAHAFLGLVYAQQLQYDQAIEEGEWAIALDPNNAENYVHQAESLNRAGRPEDALRRVEQAMRLNPHYPPDYLFELGWAYRSTGRYIEAIGALKELISRNPNFLAAHLHLAVSYWRQWVSQQSPADQTLEPAMAAIQRALALNDSFHFNHLVLGYIYLYQQQYEQALAEMERAVALAPNEAWSYAGLAEVLSWVGRSEDALGAAEQALRLKCITVDEHLASVGTAYAVAGHYEEARAVLQRYLSRYPNILTAHLMLASVYSELGQTAEARAEAAEVLRLNPNFSLTVHKERMPIKDPAVLEQHIDALRKAGLK